MGGAFLGAAGWPSKYLPIMAVVFVVGVFVAWAAWRAQNQAATKDEDR